MDLCSSCLVLVPQLYFLTNHGSTMAISHFLHGKQPNQGTVALTYGLGLGATALVWLQQPGDWTLFQQGIFWLLGMDLFGGVIANHSSSTKAFWQSRPLWMQHLFLVLHGLQPLVVGLVFDGISAMALGVLWLYVLVVGSVLLHLSASANKIGVGLGLTLGTLGWVQWADPIWAWFGLAYLIKLLSGFSSKTAGQI